jgi:hypothetical protein
MSQITVYQHYFELRYFSRGIAQSRQNYMHFATRRCRISMNGSGGFFDDMTALTVIAEMYTDDAMPWARLDCELSRPKAPVDAFRKLMIAACKSLRQST